MEKSLEGSASVIFFQKSCDDVKDWITEKVTLVIKTLILKMHSVVKLNVLWWYGFENFYIQMNKCSDGSSIEV